MVDDEWDDDPPAPRLSMRSFLIRDWPYIAMLILGVFGVALTSYARPAVTTFWITLYPVFGITRPKRLAADTAYGSGGNLAWLMERGIEPHIPVLDRVAQTTGVFTRHDRARPREAQVWHSTAEALQIWLVGVSFVRYLRHVEAERGDRKAN